VRLRLLTPLIAAATICWQPALASAQVLTPSAILRVRFTVDPSTFPVNPNTGQPRLPDLLLLTLGQHTGVTSYTVSIFDGETLLGTQETGPQGTFYFRAASSAFGFGTVINFASIQAGSIEGRIDARIDAGTLVGAPQIALGETFSSNGFFGFGAVASTSELIAVPIHTRVAPFDLGDACRRESEFGTATTRATENEATGALSLDVQARRVGNATGTAGVGFDFVMPFSGTVLITAHVAIIPPSSDITWLLHPIPRIGSFGEVSLDSAAYIEAGAAASIGSPSSTIRRIFLTPLNPGPIAPVPNIFRRPQLFVAHLYAAGVTGEHLRICAGVRAQAVSAAPFGFLANAQASYRARVIRITVEPQ
jgi:hypothetical protein